jgi:hypothetical protein
VELRLAEQLVYLRPLAREADGGCIIEGASGPRAEAENGRVIRQVRAVAERHRLALRIDRGQGLTQEAGAELGRDTGQLAPLGRIHREGLVNQHWPVGEFRIGADERQLDPIAGQLVKRQQSLHPGDPAPDHNDPGQLEAHADPTPGALIASCSLSGWRSVCISTA